MKKLITLTFLLRSTLAFSAERNFEIQSTDWSELRGLTIQIGVVQDIGTVVRISKAGTYLVDVVGIGPLKYRGFSSSGSKITFAITAKPGDANIEVINGSFDFSNNGELSHYLESLLNGILAYMR